MTLSELRALLGEGVPPGRGDEDSARRQWWAALATLQEDLLAESAQRGVWLAAPLPALYEPALLRGLAGWVWTPTRWSRSQIPGLRDWTHTNSVRGGDGLRPPFRRSSGKPSAEPSSGILWQRRRWWRRALQ